MIKSKKELIDCLKEEKKLYGKIYYLLPLFNLSENSIIWRYQKSLRKWEYHLNSNHKLRTMFYRAKTTSLGNRYGFHIHPNNFDTGLYIAHLGSILINKEARVGKNCKIHINTSLVASGGLNSAPHLGDNCYLGVGATLIGNITLKNNVVIGANATVTKSFEESNITLVGCPAKIICKNN